MPGLICDSDNEPSGSESSAQFASLPYCYCSVTGRQVAPTNIFCNNNNIIFSHVIENLENIERHANHRPGYYKDNVSPLIHGLFSR